MRLVSALRFTSWLTILILLQTFVQGGAFYHRLLNRKVEPIPGKADVLKKLEISTRENIVEAAICSNYCTVDKGCITAQYQFSTKRCTTLSVSISNTSVVKVVEDEDYIIFSVNVVS